MAMYAVQLRAEPLRTIAYDDISTSYSNVGTALDHPIRILKMDNQTDVLLTCSFNASTDHFVLPPLSFLLIDVTANEIPAEGFYISKGSQLAVKYSGSAPTEGAVYLSAFYSGN